MSNFARWHCSLNFTCLYYFQWPWPCFKVTARLNNWKLCSLSFQLCWTFVRLSSKSSRQLIYHYFSLLHTFKGDNSSVSDLTKTLTLAFGQTLFKGGLSSFVWLWLAQGLAVHTRFDDHDVISRSQVCQNQKLQTVVRFLPTVV